MRRALPHLTALFCGVAAALVVGCGDRSHLIPPTRADGLKATLASVQQDIAAGRCAQAGTGIRQLRAQVENLPASVDRRLKSNLRQGVNQLGATFGDDCANNQQTVDTTTTETQTVQTQTTDTTATQTTDTTATQTTDTTATQTTTGPTPTVTQPTETGTTQNGGTPGEPQP